MLVNRVGCVTNCVKREKEVVGDLTLNLSCVYNSRERESRELDVEDSSFDRCIASLWPGEGGICYFCLSDD